jgi:hypothetical protein
MADANTWYQMLGADPREQYSTPVNAGQVIPLPVPTAAPPVRKRLVMPDRDGVDVQASGVPASLSSMMDTVPQPSGPAKPMAMPPRPQLNSLSVTHQTTSKPSYDQEYIQAFKQAMEQRQAGLGGMEKQLAEEKAKPRTFSDVDLSPLMSLTDSLSGSQLTKNYKRPLGDEEKQLRYDKMQGDIRGERNNIVDDQLKYLKEQSSQARDTVRMQQQDARAYRADAQQNNKFMYEVKKDFDKQVDPAIDGASKINQAESALMSGNPNRITGAMSIIARVVNGEKGALSNDDVTRTMATNVNLYMAQLENFWKTNPNAQVPPELLNPLKQSVAEYKKHTSEAVGKVLDNRRDEFNLMGINGPYVDNIYNSKKQVLGGLTGYQPGAMELGLQGGNDQAAKMARMQELIAKKNATAGR